MGTGSPPSLPSPAARADCNALCGVFDVGASEKPAKPRNCGASDGHGSGKGGRKHDGLVLRGQKTAGGWEGFAPVALGLRFSCSPAGCQVPLILLPPAAACPAEGDRFPRVSNPPNVSPRKAPWYSQLWHPSPASGPVCRASRQTAWLPGGKWE